MDRCRICIYTYREIDAADMQAERKEMKNAGNKGSAF